MEEDAEGEYCVDGDEDWDIALTSARGRRSRRLPEFTRFSSSAFRRHLHETMQQDDESEINTTYFPGQSKAYVLLLKLS